MVHPARNEDGFLLKDPRDDGAVFLRYGPLDVALGWPPDTRSHPRVIEAKDMDTRGKIVEVLARKWWFQ
jgi:hypothetical protein